MRRAAWLLSGFGAGLLIAARRNDAAWRAADVVFRRVLDELVTFRVDRASLVRALEQMGVERDGAVAAHKLAAGMLGGAAQQIMDLRQGIDLYRATHVRVVPSSHHDAIAEWETQHGSKWQATE